MELKEVKKHNDDLEYQLAKREGDLKLKSDELKRKDQSLVVVTQCFNDHLDKARWDVKLGEENISVIMKAYEDLVGQVVS